MRNVCVLDVWVFMMIKPPECGGGGVTSYSYASLWVYLRTSFSCCIFQGGIQESFIRGSSVPRSKPLPFYIDYHF